MFKSVFKEIIIILLLILAIILLLGILFYDYMPSSKIVPEKVEEYAIDDEIKQELEKELDNANSDEVVKTYQLDATDLEVYEKTKEYNKGKVNPFAETNSNPNSGTSNSSGEKINNSNGNIENNSNSNTNQNNGSNINNNTNNNSSSSTGTFLNTVGK